MQLKQEDKSTRSPRRSRGKVPTTDGSN